MSPRGGGGHGRSNGGFSGSGGGGGGFKPPSLPSSGGSPSGSGSSSAGSAVGAGLGGAAIGAAGGYMLGSHMGGSHGNDGNSGNSEDRGNGTRTSAAVMAAKYDPLNMAIFMAVLTVWVFWGAFMPCLEGGDENKAKEKNEEGKKVENRSNSEGSKAGLIVEYLEEGLFDAFCWYMENFEGC